MIDSKQVVDGKLIITEQPKTPDPIIKEKYLDDFDTEIVLAEKEVAHLKEAIVRSKKVVTDNEELLAKAEIELASIKSQRAEAVTLGCKTKPKPKVQEVDGPAEDK